MSRWRYLKDEGAPGAAGLAADEAAMHRYGRGREPPAPATLRLYTYRPHCALVGRYQNLEEEVDLEFCRGAGIEPGRRPTGGGAIIMGPGQLGVAITARAAAEETPREALRRYAAGVIGGLAALGVESQFRSKNDLEVGGRKIAGLGLYLDPRGAILFHASVLADLDVPLMLQVLRIPGAKLSDKAVARVGERVTTVSRERGAPVAAVEIRERFAAGLAAAFGVELEPGALDAEERALAGRLTADRYGAAEWIHARSPRRDARGSAVLKTPEGLVRIYVGVHGGVIKSALVAGDFNVLPPGVGRLEAALKWRRVDAEGIRAAVEGSGVGGELGIAGEAVAAAVLEAAERGRELEETAHPVREGGSCYFPEQPAGTAAGGEERG